jgi:ribonuclease HII
MDLYRHDQAYREQGFRVVAGVDEAGRGPVAGPVVAAAVVLHEDGRILGLRDSKKVPEKERRELFMEVLSLSAHIGVGIVGHEEIDRANILQATKTAMCRAVDDLDAIPDMLVIDAVALPFLNIRQISPFRAESLSASVAAASIVAKYTRDVIMIRYHDLYPQYNFRKHKGYCTEEHLALIRRHGPSPIHRKSFKKVMSLTLPL